MNFDEMDEIEINNETELLNGDGFCAVLYDTNPKIKCVGTVLYSSEKYLEIIYCDKNKKIEDNVNVFNLFIVVYKEKCIDGHEFDLNSVRDKKFLILKIANHNSRIVLEQLFRNKIKKETNEK